MYNFVWLDNNKYISVSTDHKCVLPLANFLENSKTKFKIFHQGDCIVQEHMGAGGFEYWLNNDQKFY